MSTTRSRSTDSKFTARLTKKAKRNLVRRSRKTQMSMNAVINAILEQEETEQETRLGKTQAERDAEADAWIKRNLGILAGKVKPEDWEREDRIGDMLRKYVPR